MSKAAYRIKFHGMQHNFDWIIYAMLLTYKVVNIEKRQQHKTAPD